MSLSATLFGRDSAIFRITNVLGLGIPGWLDKKFGPPETEGPRLEDLSVQTSTYGTDIPRLYGTVAMSGNLIWLENGKLKEVVKKKKSGGKGGGAGSEPTTTYSYFATFALALCEGEIAGVRRIWCSDKLIYNAGSGDLETIIASNKAAKGFTIYRGTDDQLPDPRYEASVGVGNAPAFRGLAYIVFRDFALAPYSDTLQGAQFKVEVLTESDSATQITTRSIGYTQSFNNPSFIPHAYYVTPDRVDFYVPKWQNDYPAQSVYERVSVFPGGGSVRESIVVGISPVDTPPNGDSSEAGEYWKSKSNVFSGGGSFSGPDGYIQKKSGVYAGLSIYQGMKLYRKKDDSNEISVPTDALCFAISGSTIIGVTGESLVTYDENLNIISDVPFVIHGLVFPNARAEVVDSGLMIYNGASIPKVYLRENDGAVYLKASIQDTPGSDYACSIAMSEQIVVRAYPNISTKQLSVEWVNLEAQDSRTIPLDHVVRSEIGLSGLLTDDDVETEFTSEVVRGYRVTGGSIRGALEPLQTYSPFDVVQSGYKIKFIPRGRDSALTIPYTDLFAGDDGLGTVLEQPREMDSQLPSKTTIKYLDASREYAVSSQYYQRTSTRSVNAVETELAIVMTAADAAKIAEIQTFRAWLERTTSSFSLPPNYLQLEPGDVITIAAPDAQYELRIAETNMTQDGRIECKAAPNRAALYTSNAVGGDVPGPDGTIGLAGISVFIPLDIPVVDETVQNDVGFIGVMTGYSNGWPGALLVRSNDEGQTFTDLQAFQGKATLGYARGILPASSGTLIDQRALVVDLLSGELDSVTQDQMLSGTNYAAYGADQRWEIVRFQNAVLQSDGSYAVSGFVRGERGTEWATGLHAAGDAFVLLDDPDNAFINAPVESIGLNRLYRGVTAGDPVDEATDVNFAYRGVNLECLSPVYPAATRDSSGNLTGSFTRRSRLSSSWWTTGVAAPVGETTEAYEIDVMSGTTVKRTLSVSSPAFAYTAAQQAADFGAAQSAITFRIYQLSSVVGRGYPLEVTL